MLNFSFFIIVVIRCSLIKWYLTITWLLTVYIYQCNNLNRLKITFFIRHLLSNINRSNIVFRLLQKLFRMRTIETWTNIITTVVDLELWFRKMSIVHQFTECLRKKTVLVKEDTAHWKLLVQKNYILNQVFGIFCR